MTTARCIRPILEVEAVSLSNKAVGGARDQEFHACNFPDYPAREVPVFAAIVHTPSTDLGRGQDGVGGKFPWVSTSRYN